MVEVLIIAGGVGERVGQEVPKQFLSVYDKPLIIYTLEAFQKHSEIDGITVVCLDGWHDVLKAYCRQFGISKLNSVVSGGKTGQESIYLGLQDIKKHYNDCIVMIHEAVRPLVSDEVISDSICVCKDYGSAVASLPCLDAMFVPNGSNTSCEQVPRDKLLRAQNPHTFPLSKLLWAHEEALKWGITNSVATSTLMVEMGETLHLSKGSEKNFKITTYEDIEIFKAILKTEEKLS